LKYNIRGKNGKIRGKVEALEDSDIITDLMETSSRPSSHTVVHEVLNFETHLPDERGKAGSHEPPPFPLPCHILAFSSSGSHEPPLFPLPYHHI